MVPRRRAGRCGLRARLRASRASPVDSFGTQAQSRREVPELCASLSPDKIALFDPLLVEADVLDRLPLRSEVAVGYVDCAVAGLNHGRVVILVVHAVRRPAIEMALPLPGRAFVLGDRAAQ